MIDASKGFVKEGPKNRLRAQDIHRIVDVFNKQMELKGYSRMVPVAEIANPINGYNLNIPRYIDSREPEDLHDLDAHLNGGIPDRDIEALNAYWTVFPSLRQALFKGNVRPGYSDVRVDAHQVKDVILGHEEFKSFEQRIGRILDSWQQAHEPLLRGIECDTLPKSIIHTLSEDLLQRFTGLPLLDTYDIYQQLMDYWDDVMQDDAYLVAADGWLEAARPRGIVADKATTVKETPDLTVKRRKYKMDLVPPALIVDCYFAAEQENIERLQVSKDTASGRLAEFVEEHSGEGGLLEDAANDQGNVTRNGVKGRYRAISDPDCDEEGQALLYCWVLMDNESKASKALREAKTALDREVLDTYSDLDEEDIKTLVVENKWLDSINDAVNDKILQLAQQLDDCVRDLGERYARTLSELEQEAQQFCTRVNGHLKILGFELE
jgi:type I restriction enzyme M protein